MSVSALADTLNALDYQSLRRIAEYERRDFLPSEFDLSGLNGVSRLVSAVDFVVLRGVFTAARCYNRVGCSAAYAYCVRSRIYDLVRRRAVNGCGILDLYCIRIVRYLAVRNIAAVDFEGGRNGRAVVNLAVVLFETAEREFMLLYSPTRPFIRVEYIVVAAARSAKRSAYRCGVRSDVYCAHQVLHVNGVVTIRRNGIGVVADVNRNIDGIPPTVDLTEI